MTKNIGPVDKTLRIIAALVLAVLYFTDVVTGTLAFIVAIIAIALAVTALIGYCPGYVPLRKSTRKSQGAAQ